MATPSLSVSSSMSSNRIPDLLKRLDQNQNQPEAVKTCYSLLSLLCREDAHKQNILTSDGLKIILNCLNLHLDRVDIQETGNDLLWSLAFNNPLMKDMLIPYEGAVVIIKGLKRHVRNPEFVKSACGALSNICQHPHHQQVVALQGGLQPLVSALQLYQNNTKLLPYLFDAAASVIVNNVENAKLISSLGLIPVIMSILELHKNTKEVVKSGCHCLAIMSDVKGQASKIAYAGGVSMILNLVEIHLEFSELHRVSAVVLLRMLQESSIHVGKEVCNSDGVRILLLSLGGGRVFSRNKNLLNEKINLIGGGAQQDTVAAVTHILYTVTNVAVQQGLILESQLWHSGEVPPSPQFLKFSLDQLNKSPSPSNSYSNPNIFSAKVFTSLLDGLVQVLGHYMNRRDVARATSRLLLSLTTQFTMQKKQHTLCIALILDVFFTWEKLLSCVTLHKDARDVLEATVTIAKIILKAKTEANGELLEGSNNNSMSDLLAGGSNNSTFSFSLDGKEILTKNIPIIKHWSGSLVEGLYITVNTRSYDELYVTICFLELRKLVKDSEHFGETKRKELDEACLIDGEIWYLKFLLFSNDLMKLYLDYQANSITLSIQESIQKENNSQVLNEEDKQLEKLKDKEKNEKEKTKKYDVKDPQSTFGSLAFFIESLFISHRLTYWHPSLSLLLSQFRKVKEVFNVNSFDRLLNLNIGSDSSATNLSSSYLQLHKENQPIIYAMVKSVNISDVNKGIESCYYIPSNDLIEAGGITAGQTMLNDDCQNKNKDNKSKRPPLHRSGTNSSNNSSNNINISSTAINSSTVSSSSVVTNINSSNLNSLNQLFGGPLNISLISHEPIKPHVPGGCYHTYKAHNFYIQHEEFREEFHPSLSISSIVLPETCIIRNNYCLPLHPLALYPRTRLLDDSPPHPEPLRGWELKSVGSPKKVTNIPELNKQNSKTLSSLSSFISEFNSNVSAGINQLNQNSINAPTNTLVYENSKLPGGFPLAPKIPYPSPYLVSPGTVNFSSPEYDLSSASSKENSSFSESSNNVLPPESLPPLTFSSEFEGGNLYRAVRTGPAEYDLMLRPDVHTQGHTQWFYFAVSNTHPWEQVQKFWESEKKELITCNHPHKNEKDKTKENKEKLKEVEKDIGNGNEKNSESIEKNSETIEKENSTNPTEFDEEIPCHLDPDDSQFPSSENSSSSNTPKQSEEKFIPGKVVIKFNIINFCKPDSLFNMGMKPVFYSHYRANKYGIGWRHEHTDAGPISYYMNDYGNNSGSCYYTLSFSVSFTIPGDTSLIAYSFPYTYSDHLLHMEELFSRVIKREKYFEYLRKKGKDGSESDDSSNHIDASSDSDFDYSIEPGKLDFNDNSIIKRYKLCNTLSGGECEFFVITDFNDNPEQIGPITIKEILGDNYEAELASNSNGTSGTSLATSGSESKVSSKKKKSNSTSSSINSSHAQSSPQINSVTPASYRPVIFISCRVHPGETPASWVMRGSLDALVSTHPLVVALRKYCIIIVVPMLNPDGVRIGNTRCSLAAKDLNRQWKLPMKNFHPTIYYFKQLMLAHKKIRDIVLYIDLHGHSRKHNLFMYGCDDGQGGQGLGGLLNLVDIQANSNPSSSSQNSFSSTTSSVPFPVRKEKSSSGNLSISPFTVRYFPRLLSQHCIAGKYISYNDCNFNFRKGREGTARVVVMREILSQSNSTSRLSQAASYASFTLEASFCGVDFGPHHHTHMSIGQLQEVGVGLVEGIYYHAITEGIIPLLKHGKNNNSLLSMCLPNGNKNSIFQVTTSCNYDLYKHRQKMHKHREDLKESLRELESQSEVEKLEGQDIVSSLPSNDIGPTIDSESEESEGEEEEKSSEKEEVVQESSTNESFDKTCNNSYSDPIETSVPDETISEDNLPTDSEPINSEQPVTIFPPLSTSNTSNTSSSSLLTRQTRASHDSIPVPRQEFNFISTNSNEMKGSVVKNPKKTLKKSDLKSEKKSSKLKTPNSARAILDSSSSSKSSGDGSTIVKSDFNDFIITSKIISSNSNKDMKNLASSASNEKIWLPPEAPVSAFLPRLATSSHSSSSNTCK